jgi:hypothetical protein
VTKKQQYTLLRKARTHLHNTRQGYLDWEQDKVGSEWKAAEAALAKLERDLKPEPAAALGPVSPGGASVLTQDLTHLTGGLDDYPAFDGVFDAGGAVIAPEALTVTRQSSARRRDGRPNGKAFYATGASKLKYWFGHVDAAPAVNARFRKGQVMCKVSSNHEAPHLHVGIDAKALTGKRLLYGRTGNGPDYTRGSPTVGAQLARALT